MSRALRLGGQTFGAWTVLKRGDNAGRRATWLCACVCGKTRPVLAEHLSRGASRSCGCQKRGRPAKAKPPKVERPKARPMIRRLTLDEAMEQVRRATNFGFARE